MTARMPRRRVLKGLAGAGVAAALPSAAQGQPEGVITIVVPYAPGGTTDLLGRMIAREMGAALSRPIVVDNRAGAGSGVGASFVARAAADGNTLLLATSSTLAINPWLYKKLAYDPVSDFTPVGMIGAVPLVFVVNPSLPVDSIASLIAWSRTRSGGASYGSAGNGSPQHLVAELFRSATGAKLAHVPYKGSAPALVDLLGGQIDVMFSDIPPALSHLRSGRLRALAVTSSRRQAMLQDVPTVGEAGAPVPAGFQGVAWQALVAPSGTPPRIVDRYAEVLTAVMNRREVRARLLSEGVEPWTMTSKQLAAHIRSETDRWGKVIKASDVSMD